MYVRKVRAVLTLQAVEPARRGKENQRDSADVLRNASTASAWPPIARSAWIASAVGSCAPRAQATSARTSSPRRTLAGVAPQSARNSAHASSSTDTRATRAPHADGDGAPAGGV